MTIGAAAFINLWKPRCGAKTTEGLAMNRLDCPRCDNALYTAAKDKNLPCPYCGFVLKVTDPERRTNERLACQKGCDILLGAERISVKTVDISDTGLGIKLLGALPVSDEEPLGVFVDDTEAGKMAQVVWTRNVYGVTRAGLRFC